MLRRPSTDLAPQGIFSVVTHPTRGVAGPGRYGTNANDKRGGPCPPRGGRCLFTEAGRVSSSPEPVRRSFPFFPTTSKTRESRASGAALPPGVVSFPVGEGRTVHVASAREHRRRARKTEQ